jgi:MIP family channel proteins
MAAGGDEYMKSYFDELDVDGSGSLDFMEVKKALKKAGKYAGEGQIQLLLEAADMNGDGTLDFEEFKILMSMPPEKDDDTYRGAAAEFIGLILFQFFGGLAAAGAPGNGVVLAVLIYCTAAISGGHLNPAVSLALCITKQIPPKKMALYMVAQFAGGCLGAFFYKEMQDSPGCTLPCGGSGAACQLTSGNVFGIEFLATFLLVFTVFGSAVDPKSGAGNYAPMAIGFSLFVAATCIGEFTGAGLNPARTLCPAIIHDCWNVDGFGDAFQWAYVLAQFTGGAAAGVLYYFAFLNRPGDGNKKASSAFQFMATETKAVKERLEKSK